LPLAVYWDLAAFTLIIGTIVGRLGCTLHGCCAGRVASGWWALNLPDHEGVWRRRLPTQLMESAWSTIVLAGAVQMWHHLPFHGAVLIWVVGAYAAGRIVLEAMRSEQERINGIRVQQAISIAIVCMAIAAFASGG
jgi:phosphatidylglycerol---prolipoprotein diacylglyceryl transferase